MAAKGTVAKQEGTREDHFGTIRAIYQQYRP